MLSMLQMLAFGQKKALKFEFDLSGYPENPEKNALKQQLEEAGKILGSFIEMDSTVYVTVKSENCGAVATGGPDFYNVGKDIYYVNDPANFKLIVKRAKLTLCTKGAEDMVYKSQVNTLVHELIHGLGATKFTASFKGRIVSDSIFNGPITQKFNGGTPVILERDSSHFKYKSQREFPLGVAPAIRAGGGQIISSLDLAILADLGYKIPILSGKASAFHINLDIVSTIHGDISYDQLLGERIWTVSGMGGNDVLTNNGISQLVQNGPHPKSPDFVKSKLILVGNGGDDVLITGNIATQMYGDYALYNYDTLAGRGSDVFYITNNIQHSICNLESNDRIFFNPTLNITNDNIANLGVRYVKNFPDQWPYSEFEVTVGSIKLSFQSRNSIRDTAIVRALVRSCITLTAPNALAKIIGASPSTSNTTPTTGTTATTPTTPKPATNTTTSQPIASLAPSSSRNFSGAASDAVSLNTSIATELSGGSALTVEYWFKGSLLQSAFRLQDNANFIVAGWGTTPVHLLSNEGFNNTLKIQTKSGATVQDNQWHHVAFTWSRGTANGFVSYVDGEQVDIKNAGSAVLPSFSNISPVLGAFNTGGAMLELTNGQLARVRVWKVARTAQEIKDNMGKDLASGTANMLYQGNGNTAVATATTTTTTTTTTSNTTTTTSQPIASLAPSSGRNFSGAASDAVSLNTSIATELSGGSALTVEYWFKGTQIQSAFRLQSGNNFIVAGYGADPVHLLSNEGFNNTLKIQTKSGATVQDNQWHHIALTWSRGTPNGFVSYVDGEQVDIKNAGSAVLPNFSNISPILGAFNTGGAMLELTNGQLARVRVWKVARTAQEIKDNMGKDLASGTANMLYQGNGSATTATPSASTTTPKTTTPTNQPVSSLTPTSGRNFGGVASDVVTLNTSIAADLSGGSALTVEYWFKGTQIQSAFRLQSGNNFIVAGYGADPVHLLSNEGFNNTLKIQTKSGATVQDNQWHHIALTWSRGTPNGFISYVDGEQVDIKNAGSAVLPAFTTLSPTMLGAFNTGGAMLELTNGRLASVRVWKVARTAQEIKDNLNQDLPEYTANLLYQSRF